MIDLIATVDDFLCRALRGEHPPWPDAGPEFGRQFIQRSFHHGVQPLVMAKMRNSRALEQWPLPIRESLLNAQRAAAVVDMLRTVRISEFFGLLVQRGVSFLLTKGEGLGRVYYPDSFLRPRGDTDLFIDLKQIESVKQALLDSGFQVYPPFYKRHQFTGISEHLGNVRIVIDVHWRILNAPQFARSIRFAEAFEDSVPVPGLKHGLTLGTADSLLLACMHRKGSENHDEDRLIWLYDIHILIGEMTPEQLMNFTDEALEKGVQSACHDGMCAAMSSLGTAIPSDVLARLNSAKSITRYSESNLALIVDDMKYLPDWHARFNLIGELLFPAPDLLLQKYEKKNRLWLPVLYLGQLMGGVYKRLTLR